MLIGYARVSKADGSQVLDLQRDALVAAGVAPRAIYEDRASGRRDDRPGLDGCLKALRPGDTLVVWKLDRLGRDLRHLVNTVHALTGQGVGLRVLAGHGAALDTTTPAGKLVFAIFAALAEFERDLIVERTRAGLHAARARGRRGGRPFKVTPAKLRLIQAALGRPETRVGDLCRELGISRQTLYRHVAPDGTLRADGRRVLAPSSVRGDDNGGETPGRAAIREGPPAPRAEAAGGGAAAAEVSRGKKARPRARAPDPPRRRRAARENTLR